VAAEGATFAVPDGLSGGLSLKLAQLPHRLGLYMAVSGRPLDRAMAYQVGLVTHCIDQASFNEIRERLAGADPVDDLLDQLHRDPGLSPLTPHLPTLEGCMDAGSPEAIVRALEAWRGPDAAWARELGRAISVRSARHLDLVHRVLTGQSPTDLRSALTLEFRLALNASTLARPHTVDALFAVPGSGDLELPPEPQAPSIS
jgi:enoyl-CoA hydratase